jgi:putative membrane-bound dehydrogenase-like protein
MKLRFWPLALLLGLLASTPTTPAEEPAALKVLFLGDQGHHRPADRAEQLIPVMAGRGIAITYTEQCSDLNPETLARYDALIIYANIERITPEQEQALLDYVAGGGGFVPIHCASYCFLNSDAYVALVGAQFQRHGTGVFETKVVDPDHPIMKGLELFKTWDETYVHHRHNPDRHVLQVRPDPQGNEPWTWVRTQGKGRVFYTAYGHDARTWGHPGFHDLIERGLRWASGKGEVFDSRPRVSVGLKPFEYEPAKIPYYVPEAKWGTQGEPINRMQKPVDPAESMKHMAVPRGFEVRLFAAEPDVVKPITMAWDHKGRLWIVESVDYPNDKHPKTPGRDRIKICEDTDGDGRADKFTVFAEGLNIPTSLTFANGGIALLQAPDVLFLKDNDGDDKADERRVLFTGWGTYDTHAGPSNLRWGFDNWIWGIVGYSGFRGTVGGERLNFSQGFFRFRPDGSKLEFLRSTSNNSWGVGFSEEGLVFGSTANGCPSVYLSIPNRYYEKVRGWSPNVLEMISDSHRFFPVTAQVRQVDWHGGFTAGAGHALYTARVYPKHYWNKTAFVAEPTGHLVATFTLHPHGADFVSHNAWNLVASDDEWTSPILAEVGPDGNVWIIDWYNFIVQHNPTPQGYKTGKGNAYETPLRDKTHGRIYRIVAKDAKPSAPLRLDPSNPQQLVATLQNDNLFWRMHAQRLLVERGRRDVVPDLIRLVKDDSVDAIGLNPGAIHALWTLQGLGALQGDGQDTGTGEAAVSALKHHSAGVRRNALQVLPRDDHAAERILTVGVLQDQDAQVRLAALLALSELPTSQNLGSSIADILISSADGKDPWLRDALTIAAAAHDHAFLSAVAARRFEKPPSQPVLAVIERVAEHHARGGPVDSVGSLLTELTDSNPRVAESIITGLSRGWPKGRPARLDAATEMALKPLLDRLSLGAQGQLVGLVTRWGSRAFERYAAEISESLLAMVRDESKTESNRIEAARQLIEFRRNDAEAAKALLALITPKTAPGLATGLIESIGHSEAPGTGPALIETLATATPTIRPAALRVLLGRGEWTAALLDAIEHGQVRMAELALDQQQALTRHPNRPIARRAQRLIAQGGGLPDPDRQKVIDAMAPTLLQGGDPARGKLVFQQQCAKCHKHSGEGSQVGPDLTGMAAHPRSELIVHILDPSRSVEGNYVQYTVATSDGRVLNGLLASETKTAIELIDAEGKTHTLSRDEIEELSASKKSLMPEGFEKQISAEGLADLLAFLTQHGRYLPLDLRKVATAVSTKGMFYDENNSLERLIFADWSPKTFEGIPFLLVDPQGGRVPNVVLLHSPQGTFPPRMPRSVTLPCGVAAKAIHLLSGVSGWGYPGGEQGSVSLIVRLHYTDGKTEDHPLRNGVEFADYIRIVDVSGSKLAFKLRGQQIRYLSVAPERPEKIDRIELVKGPDDTAPIVMAVTVETRD